MGKNRKRRKWQLRFFGRVPRDIVTNVHHVELINLHEIATSQRTRPERVPPVGDSLHRWYFAQTHEMYRKRENEPISPWQSRKALNQAVQRRNPPPPPPPPLPPPNFKDPWSDFFTKLSRRKESAEED